MLCPQCQSRMKCTDTRTYDDGTIRRRHYCEPCEQRYSSVEEVTQALAKGVHGVYETRAQLAARVARETAERFGKIAAGLTVPQD